MHRWKGSLEDQVDAACFTDPQQLLNAEMPLDLPPDGFEGAFEVTLSATDGAVKVEETFGLSIPYTRGILRYQVME